MTQKEVQEVQKVAKIANEMLVINEIIKQIEEETLELWNPINIVVDAVGKYDIQVALSHHLDTLKQELKENITLL